MSLPQAVPGFTTIFRANGRSPLHMLQIVTLAFAAGGVGLAVHLAYSPSQVLMSAATKALCVVGLATTALSGPVATWFYGRRLASCIQLSHDGKRVRVRDGNWLGGRWRTLMRDHLLVGALVPGDVAGESSIASPRFRVGVRGSSAFLVPLDRQRDAVGPLLRALGG